LYRIFELSEGRILHSGRVLDLQKACSQSPDKFSKIWRRPGAIWTGFARNGTDRKPENARFWEPAFKGTFRGPPRPTLQRSLIGDPPITPAPRSTPEATLSNELNRRFTTPWEARKQSSEADMSLKLFSVNQENLHYERLFRPVVRRARRTRLLHRPSAPFPLH
jgi:hypothetical protein